MNVPFNLVICLLFALLTILLGCFAFFILDVATDPQLGHWIGYVYFVLMLIMTAVFANTSIYSFREWRRGHDL